MRKLMLLMSIPMGIVLATVPVQAARGDRMISFSAGTAMPRRDFVGRAPAGVIGGVGLEYLATAHLAVGIEGAFVRFGDEAAVAVGTPVTRKSTMMHGSAHLKYMVTETRISPFVLVGLGAYRVKDSSESSDPMFDSTGRYDTFWGTRAGLGLTYKSSDRVSIRAEGALHGVWTSFNWNNGFVARSFISVQTGVSIGIGNPAD